MGKEIIIEKYGQGNAVVVFDNKKIIDLFIDPRSDSKFYPPLTFVEAKIQRRLPMRGGFFIRLPNGLEGFLKAKNKYKEGEKIVALSEVFFDEDKPQTFTDKLKIVSKYFILKLGKSGFAFSNKVPKKFKKETLIPILEKKIIDTEEIFIICRSRIANISFDQFIEELDKILQHHNSIKKAIFEKKKYCVGHAKKTALDKYDLEKFFVLEEQGIFERLGLWDRINDLGKRKICISNGAYLILEQTSAFFAIDVNSGKNLKIKARELNLLACAEICRLIKVLGVGGKIIIDFLPCSKPEKRIIYDFIVRFFLDEMPTNRVWGWTDGGAFELERKRDESPLKILL